VLVQRPLRASRSNVSDDSLAIEPVPPGEAMTVSRLVGGVAAGCCCLAGGGYVVYQTQTEPPTPQPPPAATVLEQPPAGSVPPGPDSGITIAAGSGPMAARALPVITGDWTIPSSLVVSYVTRQVQKYPELGPELIGAADGLYCLQAAGFVASSAYVTHDLTQAGVTVALTLPSELGPSEAAGFLKCIARVATGGGPSANNFDPCYQAWSVSLPLADDGGSQRFWILTAGTNQAWCSAMSNLYAPYGPQPL
jgi:hypothetical protein